jgi:hypothetical protein
VPTELLDLDDTDIGGTLPSEIDALSNLRSLLLAGMGLTGMIPTELGNLSALGKPRGVDSRLSCR